VYDVVLYQPEIPPNTGNVMRLCANAGVRLHLIEPLGFVLDDRQLRRAGLDYREWVDVRVHVGLAAYLAAAAPPRLYACSTRGTELYTSLRYEPGDAFLFGPETRGLPQSVIDDCPPSRRIYLPMRPDNRSLNLSNAVAIVVFEAWRQIGFAGAAPVGSHQ
jgi:tRNA (cytidine/uridine-2'-O-)-methyltransferase